MSVNNEKRGGMFKGRLLLPRTVQLQDFLGECWPPLTKAYLRQSTGRGLPTELGALLFAAASTHREGKGGRRGSSPRCCSPSCCRRGRTGCRHPCHGSWSPGSGAKPSPTPALAAPQRAAALVLQRPLAVAVWLKAVAGPPMRATVAAAPRCPK